MPERVATADGLTLHTRTWKPPGEPVGHVVLVHGLGEHSGRYEHVGTMLASSGFDVLAYDHRGHGRSDGPRGHTPSYEHLLADLDAVIDASASDSLPTVLYGHSMGGGLVLNYAIRRDRSLAGVIATSPLIRTAEPPPRLLAAIVRRLSKAAPRLPISARIDPADLACDPRVGETYLADPLTLRKLSMRMAVEILTAGRYASEHAAKLPVPTLLMHGDADRITSFDASHAFAEASGAEFVGWPGMRHELQWESCRDEALRRVVAWLNARAELTRC